MNVTEQNQYQIIFQAKVLDSVDPANLGRIRAVLLYGQDEQAQKKGVGFNEKTDKWGPNDPFIALPLLPFFFNQTPKKDELVNLIFQNKINDTQNIFYIQGPFSSVLTINLEEFQGAQANLAQGVRTKKSADLRGPDGKYLPGREGVFPKPGDVAVVGRGNSDLIIKENDVLLRSGRTIPSEDKNDKFPLQINKNRSFLQLSYFPSTKENKGQETTTTLEEKPLFIKRMIVWNISNIENNENIFNGEVGLYTMKEIENNRTDKFSIDSIPKLSIGENYSGPLEEIRFYLKNKDEASNIINKFISSLFLGFPQFNDYPIINPTNFSNGFPFVVAPSETLFLKYQDSKNPITQEQLSQKNNFDEFYSKIKIGSVDNEKNGFFIVSDNQNGSPQFNSPIVKKQQTFDKIEYSNNPKSYSILGGQNIYFISQNSKVPLDNSIYGIGEPQITGPGGFEKNTFSTVRGEELIILLEKIVAFLSSHVHNPVEKPDSKADGNGQEIAEIQTLLNQASEKILNKNIRIN